MTLNCKRRIKAIFLSIIITALLINIGYVGSINAYGSEEVYFDTYKGTKWVEGSRINSDFRLSASDGSIAYCLNEGRAVPDGGYEAGFAVSSNIKAILRYGYPNNDNFGGISLSEDQAICATQLAIWAWDKTGKGDPVDLNSLYPNSLHEPHGSNVLAAAKWLSSKAEIGYNAPLAPDLPAPQIALPSDKSIKPYSAEYRAVGPYRITSEVTPYFISDSYWIDLSSMPNGAYIGDHLGVDIKQPNNAMDFYIYLPTTYFDENPSGSLSVKFGGGYDYSYEGETVWKAYEKAVTQNVVVTASTEMVSGQMENLAEDEITWGQVDVFKHEGNENDDDTKIAEGKPNSIKEDQPPIEGTEFELFYDLTFKDSNDNEWQSLGVRKTDENGRLSFGGIGNGRYKLVEVKPNVYYSLPEENGKSNEKIFEISDKNTAEYHVFANELISISCDVDKEAISKTSAAFKHVTEGSDFDNTGKELFMYNIDYGSTSNVYADEFVADDHLEAVNEGKSRLVELWTGIYQGDYDNKMNVWYKTNLTDDETIYSEVSAMDTNPHNVNNPSRTAVYPNTGYKLWAQDVATDLRAHLKVIDLGLEEGEYITALRLEHGRVESGFTSASEGAEELAPVSYLVYCPDEILPPETLVNTVTAKIARNVILTDEDSDTVVIEVIKGFDVTPKPDEDYVLSAETVSVNTSMSPATGDTLMSNKSLTLLIALIIMAVGIIIAILLGNRKINKESKR